MMGRCMEWQSCCWGGRGEQGWQLAAQDLEWAQGHGVRGIKVLVTWRPPSPFPLTHPPIHLDSVQCSLRGVLGGVQAIPTPRFPPPPSFPTWIASRAVCVAFSAAYKMVLAQSRRSRLCTHTSVERGRPWVRTKN